MQPKDIFVFKPYQTGGKPAGNKKEDSSPKPQRQNPSDLPEAAERQEILRFVGNDLRTTE